MKNPTREEVLKDIHTMFPLISEGAKDIIRLAYFEAKHIPNEDLLERINDLPSSSLSMLAIQMRNTIKKTVKDL